MPYLHPYPPLTPPSPNLERAGKLFHRWFVGRQHRPTNHRYHYHVWALSWLFFKLRHLEGLALPGINHLDRVTAQLLQAGRRRGRVIHDPAQRWSSGIGQQVAAEQVSAGSQHADRAQSRHASPEQK